MIIAKGLDRYEAIQKKPRTLTMWTFGTSLDDTLTNRRIIVMYWKEFREEIRNYGGSRKKRLRVQLWALEAGKTGRKLHIHALVFGYSNHALMLKIWRKTTHEKSNVNYVERKYKGGSAKKAVGYISKYISKEGSKYYWGDDMLKSINNPIKTPFKCFCDAYWDRNYFNLVISNDVKIVYYDEIDDYFSGNNYIQDIWKSAHNVYTHYDTMYTH